MANIPENVLCLKRTVCDLVDNWDILTEENKRNKFQKIREFDLPGSPTAPSDITGFTDLDESTQVYLLREYYTELRAKYDDVISQNQTLFHQNRTLFQRDEERQAEIKELKGTFIYFFTYLKMSSWTLRKEWIKQIR